MTSPLAVGAVQKGSTNECFRPTKLFIGGITRNTTTKQLRDHFAAYGRVLDCVAMRQPDGRPRGFGYVTLDSPQAADRCFTSPQIVDGRVVDLKRAVPEGDMDSAPTTRLHTPGKASVVPQAAVCWPPHWTYARPIHAVAPDSWSCSALAAVEPHRDYCQDVEPRRDCCQLVELHRDYCQLGLPNSHTGRTLGCQRPRPVVPFLPALLSLCQLRQLHWKCQNKSQRTSRLSRSFGSR
jgi:hypothetical protein